MLAIIILYRVQSVDDGGVVILSSIVLAIGIAILHWFCQSRDSGRGFCDPGVMPG